jgi:ribosomal protein S18 acetylase RimI-like enzyme
VLTIRPADAARTTRWRHGLQDRLEAWYAGRGAAASVANRVADWDATPGELLTLTINGADIGHLALIPRAPDAIVYDLWIGPGQRGQGHGRAALRHAEQWAASLVTPAGGPNRIGARVWTDDPALTAIFGDYPLRSQNMIKELAPGVGFPEGITARPLGEHEYADWLANEVLAYAADLTGSGSCHAAQAMEISRQSYVDLLPDGMATPGQTIWIVEAAGDRGTEPVAAIWLGHHTGPEQSFVLSVEVRPGHRGRGFGKAAMLVGEDRCLAAGDRYLGLNVFGHNTIAMNLYRRLGYTVVDQTRTKELPR